MTFRGRFSYAWSVRLSLRFSFTPRHVECTGSACVPCAWRMCGGSDVREAADNYETAHKPHPLGVAIRPKRAFIRSEANIFSAHRGRTALVSHVEIDHNHPMNVI